MRKSAKSIITILVLAIVLVAHVAYAKISIPAATSDFYVNDFANVFSDSEKSQLMEKAVALSDEYDGIQVVVTTVESLDGNSVEDYSYEMYNQYGIGKNDMGLLILLATNDRQIRVEVGKSMEAYINDSKAGRFIDQFAIPFLKENKFNEGLINLQEALIDEVISCIESENVEEAEILATTDINRSPDSHNIELARFWSIIFIAIAFIVIVSIINSKIEARKEEIEDYVSEIERLKAEAAEIKQSASNKEESLKRDFSELSEENDNLERLYQNLQNKFNVLRDRYERAKKLYPSVDSEVTAMIEEEIRQKNIAMAKNVDSIIGKVINLAPSKDIVSRLSDAITSYQSLTSSQKSFVQSDIAKLKVLYNESLRLKNEHDRKVREEQSRKRAEEAAAKISSIISSISVGSSVYLYRLKDAKSIYDRLDSDACSYFDKSILSRLNKLYRQAEQDYEEEERRRKKREEEERKRSEEESWHYYNSSSSSFDSSSHFGGFGGESGGGGASRSF